MPARTSTHPEEDDADLHANPTPRRDRPSPRPCHSVPRIGSASPWASLQPSHPHRQRTAGPACSGHRPPISCPFSRSNSTQTAFNPHTATALTAYCKSPYPHRSAYAAAEHEKFWQRSTVDTALEIWHQLMRRATTYSGSNPLVTLVVGGTLDVIDNEVSHRAFLSGEL
jgi:hypothetical protein